MQPCDEYLGKLLEIEDLTEMLEMAQDPSYRSTLVLAYQLMVQELEAIKDRQLAKMWSDRRGQGSLSMISKSIDFPKPPPIPETAQCVSCNDDCIEYKCAPCGHKYCQKCIHELSMMCLKDKSTIPPRCCKREFPTEYIQDSLSTEEFQQYKVFFDERKWQADLDSDKEYRNVVQALNMKQCATCGVGIYKTDGCIHMTCPNGHHFCYACGLKWKTCACF